MASLINRARVRKLALEYAAKQGRPQFERVSSDFFERVEANFAASVRKAVDTHPSIGKTLK